MPFYAILFRTTKFYAPKTMILTNTKNFQTSCGGGAGWVGGRGRNTNISEGLIDSCLRLKPLFRFGFSYESKKFFLEVKPVDKGLLPRDFP